MEPGRFYLPQLLTDLGMAASRSQARRLLVEGSVLIEGEVVRDWDVSLAEGAAIRCGSRAAILTGEVE